MILAVMKAINAIVYIEAWKSKDFNGVWAHDVVIPVRRSNQLSYEATDVGSWSFVGPKDCLWGMTSLSYNMKYFIYWTADVKSSKLWNGAT